MRQAQRFELIGNPRQPSTNLLPQAVIKKLGRFMEKEKELYIKSLITLRSNLITVMIVITSGIVGLFLANITTIKLVILLIIVIYFSLIFLTNLIYVHNEIRRRTIK